MDDMKLLALVGMPGSGKSSAAEFFKSKQIPVLRFGDQTDIGLQELNLPKTEANERMYREKIRQELGMAAMAIKIVPRIEETAKTNNIIVLDGLYSWEEYLYLRNKFTILRLLAIYASPVIRYQRLANRSVRPLTREEAISRDYAEIMHLNKGGPIAMADFTIINNGTVEEFQELMEKEYHTWI